MGIDHMSEVSRSRAKATEAPSGERARVGPLGGESLPGANAGEAEVGARLAWNATVRVLANPPQPGSRTAPRPHSPSPVRFPEGEQGSQHQLAEAVQVVPAFLDEDGGQAETGDETPRGIA